MYPVTCRDALYFHWLHPTHEIVSYLIQSSETSSRLDLPPIHLLPWNYSPRKHPPLPQTIPILSTFSRLRRRPTTDTCVCTCIRFLTLIREDIDKDRNGGWKCPETGWEGVDSGAPSLGKIINRNLCASIMGASNGIESGTSATPRSSAR